MLVNICLHMCAYLSAGKYIHIHTHTHTVSHMDTYGCMHICMCTLCGCMYSFTCLYINIGTVFVCVLMFIK